MKSNKTTKKFRLNHPRSVGNFYKITDNKCGHPGRIFYANADDDIYFVIKFSSKKRKDRKLMKHSIDPLSNKDQYVCKNPSQVGFDDMSYVEKYKAYRIHPDDYQLINEIEKKYFAKKKK